MGDHGVPAALAEQVERSDPTLLLPARYAGAPVTGPLTLCAAAPLRPDLWITVVRSPGAGLLAAPVVTAGGTARRAVPGDGAAVALLEMMSGESALGARSPGAAGEGFVVARLTRPGLTGGERAMDVDQTHESVVVADSEVVKWSVTAEPTPAPTLVSHLAEAGFAPMPRPVGFVTWRDGNTEVLVASAVGYLRGASDGWSWTVGDASKYATGVCDLETAVEPLCRVGTLVADLHAALATPTSALTAPRGVASSPQVGEWRDLAISLLEEAVREVDGDEGDRLRVAAPAMAEVFATLDAVGSTPTIPVHGDLHVGQVLRWSGGYAVGDFDGNPVLPAVARLAPQPAARDVAGMLQSIDHVGRVVGERVEGADPTLVRSWIAQAQADFLEAYVARLGQRDVSDLFDPRLVLAFQVEQECREFLYAVRHLPRWRYVPDRALQDLIADD